MQKKHLFLDSRMTEFTMSHQSKHQVPWYLKMPKRMLAFPHILQEHLVNLIYFIEETVIKPSYPGRSAESWQKHGPTVAPAMNDQQLVVSLAIILIQFNQLSANT
jgi:hypothetical protein